MLIGRALLSGLFAAAALAAVDSLTDLTFVWGAYAMLDGVLPAVISTRATYVNERFTPFLVQGLFSVAVGLTAWLLPRPWLFAVFVLIPTWAVVNALLILGGVVRTRHLVHRPWLLAVGAGIALAVGFLFLSNPSGGGAWLTWLLATYGLVSCVMFLLMVAGYVRVSTWEKTIA
jgi:uncharacterized membrane protein HdeD (DUF308 family)